MSQNEKKDRYNVTNTAFALDTSCNMLIRMLPSRDGVKIHTAIYFPEEFDNIPAPVLLIRTPYCSPDRLLLPDKRVARDKVIYIVQSCRGTGFSGGEFDPADENIEKNDVEDLFLWLDKQPWYNGRCAMFGSSYTGWVQWCAVKTNYDGLVGISPRVAPLYACLGGAVKGGGIRHDLVINWTLNLYHRRKYGFSNMPNYEEMGVLQHLPLSSCDQESGYETVKAYQNIIRHIDAPGKILNFHREYIPQLKVPALVSGGWFDPFKDETIESFQLVKEGASTEKARNFSRLYIGPWEHAGLVNPDLFANGSQDELLEKEELFLKRLLEEPDKDPLPEMPVVRYYMLGENKWYDADSWPPKGVEYEKFYLHSKGCANSITGDGFLDNISPGDELADSYLSDPAAPTLSCGGKCNAPGCYDRTPDEQRSDILVYTTAPAKEALTIAGKVEFCFHAAASTPDTDFCAVLTMVTPDNRSLFLTVGMVRARFRNSAYQPELLVPGEIYEYVMDLSHIAVKIQPGYALCLEICGQYFPLYGRNNNTGKPLKDDAELRVSKHTIFHDAEHPAYLNLPLLKQ